LQQRRQHVLTPVDTLAGVAEQRGNVYVADGAVARRITLTGEATTLFVNERVAPAGGGVSYVICPHGLLQYEETAPIPKRASAASVSQILRPPSHWWSLHEEARELSDKLLTAMRHIRASVAASSIRTSRLTAFE